jgi:formylglycine-generating enzyme required for sulfatase activity
VQRDRGEAAIARASVPIDAPWLDLGGGVTLELAFIPAGEFMMGARTSPAEVVRRSGFPADIKGFQREHPRHRVRISRPFFLGTYEVTQAQYEQIVGSDPSWFNGTDLPVERVSWEEAVAFCRIASERSGRNVRLPSEAEWEYACRAGTTTSFHFGDAITTDQVNYDGRIPYAGSPKEKWREKTMAVGSVPPNPWGLHHMHGNVYEWCADWLDEGYYARSPGVDPLGPESGKYRVARGGAWRWCGSFCRSAARGGNLPEVQTSVIGFRVAVSVGAAQE